MLSTATSRKLLSHLEVKLCLRDYIYMLHNTPNDPVIVKKIRLKVWSLRNEIESKIRENLKNNSQINITDIAKDYPQEQKDTGNDEIADNIDGVDDGEEAMANAIEEGDSKDSSSKETQDILKISQLRPNIQEVDIIHATMFLSEINMNDILFFAGDKLLEGQGIGIEFLIPKRFIINAEVVSCRRYSYKSRIIGKNKLPFRIYAKFTFLKEGEKTLLRSFIQSILPDMPKKEARNESQNDDDDDDFSDLDNF